MRGLGPGKAQAQGGFQMKAGLVGIVSCGVKKPQMIGGLGVHGVPGPGFAQIPEGPSEKTFLEIGVSQGVQDFGSIGQTIEGVLRQGQSPVQILARFQEKPGQIVRQNPRVRMGVQVLFQDFPGSCPVSFSKE